MTKRMRSFRKALVRFREILDEPRTHITRDAAILRFEFCFELAWKCIQETSSQAGFEANSPKTCLQIAFQQGWIDEETGWLTALKDRNFCSHTYNEKLARKVIRHIPRHLKLMEGLAERLEKAGKE